MPVATAQAYHLADGHLFVIARQENGDGLIFASSRGIAIRVDSYDEDKMIQSKHCRRGRPLAAGPSYSVVSMR